MNLSSCGIDCDICKYATEQNCPGCRAHDGKPFWGGDEGCELHKCCADKKHDNCGECATFPCDTLKKWAKSENPERIDNLKKA